MAEFSRPDPATVPPRLVGEDEYERISASYLADGLHPDISGVNVEPGGLAPIYATGSDLNVVVRAGLYGSVRGFMWASGETNVSKAIGPNSTGSTRVDRIVLELDRSTWIVRMKVVPGTPGFGLPALTRDLGDTGVFQVHVGYVTVPNGSTTSFPAGNVVVTAQHAGTPVRAWHRFADMTTPMLGEIGFDRARRAWFGWDGVAIKDITDPYNPKPKSVINTDGGTTANRDGTEALTGATTNPSVQFTAGRNGLVVVSVSALMRSSISFENVVFGARIRRVDNNAIVYSPPREECAQNDATNNVSAANFYVYEGLTPGTSYKAVGIHLAEGGTGTFDNRSILVDPR